MTAKTDWEDGELIYAADFNSLGEEINTATGDVAGKYTKPGDGIPKTDLAAAVQTSLGKADTALQEIADSSVTSAKIANATIVSGDISPTAAIAATQLAGSVQTSLGKADTAMPAFNVQSYGALGDDSHDDTTAIGNCVAAAAAAGAAVYFPGGTYKVTAALNWKIPGLVVRGAGKNFSIIKQYTANTPLIQVAGANQDIGGLTLAYASQATSGNTSSIAIEFGDDTIGSCFDSTFHDLVLDKANTGMAINPAITVKAGMFSCTLTNIRIRDYSYSAINLVGSNGNGANCTGCVFSNVYTHRTSDAYTAAYYPIFLEYWDEVTFNQLNVEHVTVSAYDVMALIYVGSAVINALHFEVLAHSANGKALLYTHDSKVVVNGATCRFNTFTGSASNPAVRLYGTPSNASVMINGWNDSSNTVTTPARPVIDLGTATNSDVWIRGIDLAQFTARAVNGGTGNRVWEINEPLAVVNTQTDSYTLVAADAGRVVELNKATEVDLTVPLNASVPFPIGTVIEVHQYGAGQVTVVATGGVTVNAPSAKMKLSRQFASATLRKRAANEWQLEGDLTT